MSLVRMGDASCFHVSTTCDENLLKLVNPKTDYPNIRVAAARMLKAGHGLDVLAATYSRLFVDEYQDCNVPQHAIVYYMASASPTCAVLGDPDKRCLTSRESSLIGMSTSASISHWPENYPPRGDGET